VTAAGVLPVLLVYPLAGVLADRFDRRRMMILSQLARALVIGVLVWAVWESAAPKLLLPVAAVLEGVFATFYNTAEMAAFPRVVPQGMLSKAMSRNEAQSQAALVVGRPVSGILYSVNQAFPFALGIVTCLLSMSALVWMKKGNFRLERESRAGSSRLITPIRESLAWLRSDPFLRSALVVCTVTNLLFQAVILLLIVLAGQNGLSSAFIGFLLAASGAGGVLGAFAAPPMLRRIRLRRTTMICTWVWLSLITLLLVSDHPAVLLLVWCGIGLVGAHMNVALTIYQATNVPEELRGRVASLKSFATRAPAALGALLAGLVISQLGTSAATMMVFAAMLVLAITVTVRWRARRTQAQPNKDTTVNVLEGIR
jgi:MFS family permease